VAQKQVNIRLPDEDVAVLETAAYLSRQAQADLIREILQREIAKLRSQPRVIQALRLQAEQAAEASGRLTSLDAHRRRGDGDPA
jgi:hypothetical protein